MDLASWGLDANFSGVAELLVQYALSILGAFLLLLAGFLVSRFVQRWIRRALSRVGHIDETVSAFISSAARYAIWVITLIAVLGQFGVQTASILAALGAAGLAIGLALQGTLQNIAAGIMLLFLRPFKVGEYIDTGAVAGTVEEVGIFATRLTTVDGLYVLAPNSSLWNTPVTNFSRHDTRRNDIIIGIGYGDDIDKASQIMAKMAESDERILKTPSPRTFVSDLGDSAVSVTVRYWTATPDYFYTGRELTEQLKQHFDAQGISIPFPQRDLHVIKQ